jgi:type II secretory pathway pseudopilin PulG
MNGGFSIVEVLVVIGISVVIGVMSIPVAVEYYRTQILDEAAKDLRSVLRRANNQAVFQKNDSAFGVDFSSVTDKYVLYQGSAYSSRITAEDEIFAIPAGITLSGVSEVAYTKRTGTTTASTLTITGVNQTRTISISADGKVEL